MTQKKISYCCILAWTVVLLAQNSVELQVTSDETSNKLLSRSKREDEEEPNRVLPEERIQLLRTHNMFRASVTPSAANMQKIFWSKELEIGAQMLVNRCVWDHGEVEEAKKRYSTYGQNLYGGGRNVESAVRLWASEVKDYNYDSGKCNPGGVCGHYTQVVWDKSYLVGCGIAYCENLGFTMIACNYWNPGNYPRNPYTKGAPCSRCPETVNHCVDKMCTMPKLNCSIVEPDCPIVDHEYCLCDDKNYGLPKDDASPGLSTVTTTKLATQTSKSATTQSTKEKDDGSHSLSTVTTAKLAAETSNSATTQSIKEKDDASLSTSVVITHKTVDHESSSTTTDSNERKTGTKNDGSHSLSTVTTAKLAAQTSNSATTQSIKENDDASLSTSAVITHKTVDHGSSSTTTDSNEKKTGTKKNSANLTTTVSSSLLGSLLFTIILLFK